MANKRIPDCYRKSTFIEIETREREPEFRATPRHVEGKDAAWWAERSARQTTTAPDLDVYRDPFRYYFKF